jgi:hypothetical protein
MVMTVCDLTNIINIVCPDGDVNDMMMTVCDLTNIINIVPAYCFSP